MFEDMRNSLYVTVVVYVVLLEKWSIQECEWHGYRFRSRCNESQRHSASLIPQQPASILLAIIRDGLHLNPRSVVL
jgi:hypothetical protein